MNEPPLVPPDLDQLRDESKEIGGFIWNHKGSVLLALFGAFLLSRLGAFFVAVILLAAVFVSIYFGWVNF